MEQVTLGRLKAIYAMKRKIDCLGEVWSIASGQELRDEVFTVAMLIGEVSYTLRLLAFFFEQAKKLLQKSNSNKADPLDLFGPENKDKQDEELLDLLKEQGKVGQRRKKLRKRGNMQNTIELFVKSRKSLYFKLQYLSMLMFSVGRPTHINVSS